MPPSKFPADLVLQGVVAEEGIQSRAHYREVDERYAVALDGLRDGRSVAESAELIGLSAHSLVTALEKRPELITGIRARREVLRELVLLKSVQLMGERLEKMPDQVSNRDLTDFVRAVKTGDGEHRGDINIVIPWMKAE